VSGVRRGGPALDRRRWLAGAAALALPGWPMASASGATGVPAFPTRPITLWVPWAPGGATDLLLRLLAELATPVLGQPVVIANRGGAGGTLAMPVLQQAEANGYTIAQLPQPVFRAPFTQPVTWDPVRDVTPILQLSGVTFGVLAPEGGPLRELRDLFEFARSRPGELSIATNGVGTTPHLALESLFTDRGLRYIHVPYKGTAELTLAVESGQVMAGVSSSGFAPEVDAGRLRLLATLGAQRTARWPRVPTLRESGSDIVAMSPYGLVGPRGMPDAVVAVLHEAFRQALFHPRFVESLARYDQEVAYLGPEAYARACRQEYAREREAASRPGWSRDGAGAAR
jgi:tripartite-type tricarboxylate transporter receptor subunit TctC